MTVPQSLLHAAASDVTLERVRALVRQVGPEAPTIEYKEQMSDTVARGVAALANTYGGLLLIGVSDNPRIVRGVKEKTIEAVAEHCAAKIEPPWVPEIIPVPLGQGSDLYVLVLRVVPGAHPAPMLVDGVAYVRHQNTTHPADWQRLGDLFAQSTAAAVEDPWDTIRRPDLPHAANGTTDTTVDLVARTGLSFPVARDAKWRPLSEITVNALIGALNESRLSGALGDLAVEGAAVAGVNGFHRRGLNRSRTVRLYWSGAPHGWPSEQPAPVEAVVSLEVPGGYGQAATHLRLEVDVVVRHSARVQILRDLPAGGTPVLLPLWRIAAQRLGELIEALLATLTDTEVVGPLGSLAGIDPVAVPQPRVLHVVTARPVTEVIYTDGLRHIPDAGVSMGTHLLADPALDLADGDERRKQVQRWLVQLTLDAGLVGMEQMLKASTAPVR